MVAARRTSTFDAMEALVSQGMAASPCPSKRLRPRPNWINDVSAVLSLCDHGMSSVRRAERAEPDTMILSNRPVGNGRLPASRYEGGKRVARIKDPGFPSSGELRQYGVVYHIFMKELLGSMAASASYAASIPPLRRKLELLTAILRTWPRYTYLTRSSMLRSLGCFRHLGPTSYFFRKH